MSRRILTALIAVALTAATLPGVAAAGGNSMAAKNCQVKYATLGYKNRGQCTSSFAKQSAQLRALNHALYDLVPGL